MSEEQTSIFDDDTSTIQVKRSNVRRKAMIFSTEKAHEVVEKLNAECNACAQP
jgi:hypothetical protein